MSGTVAFIRSVNFSLEFEDVALRESGGQHFCYTMVHMINVNVTTSNFIYSIGRSVNHAASKININCTN